MGDGYNTIMPRTRLRVIGRLRERCSQSDLVQAKCWRGNYCRWSRDHRSIRYLTIQHPLTIEMEEQWFERITRSPNDVVWEIHREDRHIGSIGLHEIDWRHRRATGGIWIGETDEFGKGFGSEAMALRTRYAFLELGLNKVMTASDIENVASRRAAMRAGYRECGRYRKHRYCDGTWHDVWLGEVLREDWEAQSLNQLPGVN